MSIYRRDEVDGEWEPVFWGTSGNAADELEQGFHERAMKPIAWTAIPFKNFPIEGIFGLSKDPLTEIDAAYFAVLDGEELLLIDNTWFGWPDPPRWGLASRPSDRHDLLWKHWGHFPDLPAEWNVPSLEF